MSQFGDVYEYIIDGVSGLNPGGGPDCLIVGTCSAGVVGKSYTFGHSSDVSVLGKGKLVDRLKDLFSITKDDPYGANKEAVVVVVPSTLDIVGTIGTITHAGTGTATQGTSGSALHDAKVVIEILKAGALNVAEGKVSLDGGASYSDPFTIPANGEVDITGSGVKVTFSGTGDIFVVGDTYSFDITGPGSTLTALNSAIDKGLEVYTPSFVYVAEPTDSTHWASLGAKADSLFVEHKPTYFLTECRAKLESETINEYLDYLTGERTGFAHRFVAVSASYGLINGVSRNVSGLLAGSIVKARVNQSIGEVASFIISNVSIPDDWGNINSKVLDDLGYITLRRYSGLSNLYWSNGRTLADTTSDYQFIEVVETTFKAIRLSRIAALKNMQGPGDYNGIQKVKADIISSLKSMTSVSPKELDSFKVIIPENQDVVNNGLSFELELYGIPILRKIKLFFKFIYSNPLEGGN